jgi:hypothetical protein
MKTNAWQKLSVSTVNTLFIFIVSIPVFVLFGFSFEYKLAVVLLFLVYQLIVALCPARRDLGSLLTKTAWIKKYPIRNHIIFAFLYTLSFSTILIWIFFPFDLLLFNLLFIQLPFVQKTGYTLHGFLSGKMAGKKLE